MFDWVKQNKWKVAGAAFVLLLVGVAATFSSCDVNVLTFGRDG